MIDDGVVRVSIMEFKCTLGPFTESAVLHVV